MKVSRSRKRRASTPEPLAPHRFLENRHQLLLIHAGTPLIPRVPATDFDTEFEPLLLSRQLGDRQLRGLAEIHVESDYATQTQGTRR